MIRATWQKGLTLIELMIAMLLSLLIMASVLLLYLNMSRSNDDLAKTNSLIENGRFTLQLLQEDLVHAGFWNTYVPQFDDLTFQDIPADVPKDLPKVCEPFSAWNAQDKTNALGIPLQTYSAIPAGCTGIVTNRQPGTDILIVRHLDTCVPGVGNCGALVNGRPYFQATLCTSELATPYILDTQGFTLHQNDCTTLAEQRQFITNLYYIRNYSITPGDGIPTLVRAQLDLAAGSLQLQPAVPLVEGVEGFYIELGIDNSSALGAADYSQAVAWDNTNTTPTNRGDGSADEFVHCGPTSCTLDQLINAVEAKLYVLVRARTTTPGYTSDKIFKLGSTTLGPFTDAYKRHLFTSSVTLLNVSRRRQTP